MTAGTTGIVFRLSRAAYLAVLFLLFCVAPLAFAEHGGDQGGPAGVTWRVALLAVPVLAAVFIARTATFVSGSGIRVRAPFGSRTLRWDDLRGLSVSDRAIYAVVQDGAVRLPCVRVSDLAAVAKVSEGRLPAIAAPTPKFAPSRRRR